MAPVNGASGGQVASRPGATSFAVEENVTTMPSAKTLTLDGKTGHVLLIGAEFGPAPAAQQPGGRGARGPLIPDSFQILVVGK